MVWVVASPAPSHPCPGSGIAMRASPARKITSMTDPTMMYAFRRPQRVDV